MALLVLALGVAIASILIVVINGLRSINRSVLHIETLLEGLVADQHENQDDAPPRA